MVSAALIALLAIGSPADDAKRAYDKALKFSKAGEYQAALPYFERAYELSKHRPSTIVALAQCERELKLYDRAIAHFKEYLAIEDSTKIRDTIALLEELQKEELERQAKEAKPPEPSYRDGPPRPRPSELVPAPPPPPAAPPPPPPPAAIVEQPAPEPESESIIESPVFWIVTGVVVAAAATGVALGVALRPEAELYGGTSGVVLEK